MGGVSSSLPVWSPEETFPSLRREEEEEEAEAGGACEWGSAKRKGESRTLDCLSSICLIFQHLYCIHVDGGGRERRRPLSVVLSPRGGGRQGRGPALRGLTARPRAGAAGRRGAPGHRGQGRGVVRGGRGSGKCDRGIRTQHSVSVRNFPQAAVVLSPCCRRRVRSRRGPSPVRGPLAPASPGVVLGGHDEGARSLVRPRGESQPIQENGFRDSESRRRWMGRGVKGDQIGLQQRSTHELIRDE